MLYIPPKRKPFWRKALVPSSLACAIIVIVIAVFSVDTHAPFQVSAQMQTPAPLSAWDISLSSDTSVHSGQHFGGVIKPGGVLFVPTGAKFDVLSEPTETRGLFADNAAQSVWAQEGGDLDSGAPTPLGWKQ